jgi:hypothetical protein
VVARVEAHHPTGRIRGRPIHSWLVVVLCVPCHLEEHAVWHELGLESDAPTSAVLLGRIASWLDRWGRPLNVELQAALAQALVDTATRPNDLPGAVPERGEMN